MQLYKEAAVTLLNPGFVPLDHLSLQSRGYPWPVSAQPKGSQKWTQSKPMKCVTCKCDGSGLSALHNLLHTRQACGETLLLSRDLNDQI